MLEDGRNAFDKLRMLSWDDVMDFATMDRLVKWGFSRVPVYRGRRTNIVGVLLLKEHIALDPDDAVPVSSLRLRRPCVVTPSTSVFEVLNLFQTGRSHMAIVSPHAELIEARWRERKGLPDGVEIHGVCTIEDVMEEMIGEEIADEFDEPHLGAASINTVPTAGETMSDPLLPYPRQFDV